MATLPAATIEQRAGERPRVTFKATPEDFVVEELDAYAASGAGEHTFVRVRKRGLTTPVMIDRLARALGVDARACGYAGMKDRDAVASQRVSVPGVAPEAAMALAGQWPDLEVIEAVRHGNKLKPGHLRGNRFVIRLRDVGRASRDAGDSARVIERGLRAIEAEGFPNAFGPQRFGRDGDNADRALAFVRGDERPPRDARLRRLLFSALQSRWFNRVLEARVADRSFATPREGDLLKKHATGGLFVCEDPVVDGARAVAKEVSPTGPMFGAKMAKPGPAVLRAELDALAIDGVRPEHLEPMRALGEGARRPLRAFVDELEVLRDEAIADALVVSFALPKGVYATTVLGLVADLSGARDAERGPADEAPADDLDA